MTEGELQLALFSSNHWSEESRQVKPSVLFAVTFVIAALCAGAPAFMLGATAAPGA